MENQIITYDPSKEIDVLLNVPMFIMTYSDLQVVGCELQLAQPIADGTEKGQSKTGAS